MYPQQPQDWLHEFLAVAKENFLIFNITTKHQFISNLKMFVDEADLFASDVLFNEDGAKVKASRFFLQSEKVENPETEMLMMTELREILQKYSFEVIAFNPYFEIFDQFLEVYNNTFFCVALCSAIMSLVILVFIPKKSCVIWVTITVLSVEVGVVGLMSFWGINLDVISMIVIIMGIGFSVDFSAHISYHYLAAEEGITPYERLGHCLYALGPPILQGAATTILSVLLILRHDSYVIQTFAKMIFLVIALGLLHSLLLLPVLLSIFAPKWSPAKKSSLLLNDIMPPSINSPEVEYQCNTEADNFIREDEDGSNKMPKYSSVDEALRSFIILSNELEFSKKQEEVSKNTPLNGELHSTFFQSLGNDESDFLVTEDSVPFRSRASRAHSDSSYYSYQKRHLRRHMMPVFPKRSSEEFCDKKRGVACKQNFPNKIETIKHSLKHSNIVYECPTPNKGGVENKAFDDTDLGSKSLLSTFGTKESPAIQKTGVKLVFIDHESEIIDEDCSSEGNDSFDEVSLDDNHVHVDSK